MKRSLIALTVMLFGAVVGAQRGAPSPEMQAALAKQEPLEKSTPRWPFMNLVMPGSASLILQSAAQTVVA